MFVQVVTYSLEGITEEEYLDVANQLAARTAALPGLLAKLWLENPGGNRYGAVYFWDDLESMERFGDSDLFEGYVPEFTSFRAEEFSVLENLTAMTQPMLELIEPRRGAALSGALQASPAEGSAAKAAHPATKKRTPPPAKKVSTAKKIPVAVKQPAAVKKAAAKKIAAAKKAPEAKKGAWPAKIRKAPR